MPKVPEISVNFRTGDGDTCAGLIERELSRHFERIHLHRDDRSDEHIAAVRRSAALLVVIGPLWLAFVDGHDLNALDTDYDWLRREIVAAFEADVPVVPVFVDRAERVRDVDLPARLARLGELRYVRIDTGNPEPGLRELGDLLAEFVPEPETVAPRGGEGSLR